MTQSHAIYQDGVPRRLRLRLRGGSRLGVHGKLNDPDQNLEDGGRTESISDMGSRPGGPDESRNSEHTHTHYYSYYCYYY